jgi:hypothetical protein
MAWLFLARMLWNLPNNVANGTRSDLAPPVKNRSLIRVIQLIDWFKLL